MHNSGHGNTLGLHPKEVETHPERLLLEQSCLLLLLRLLLQLVVAHRHDGQDQVDEVEGAKENYKKKEDNVPRPGRPGE